MQFKVGLGFFVSVLTFITLSDVPVTSFEPAYILAILKEVLIGLLLGFTAYLFMTVVQVSGSFVDMQMGLGIANVLDPLTGTQAPLLGNFKFFIAILLFLSFDGHHYLLKAIIESYDIVPVGFDIFARIADGGISSYLLKSFVVMFALAFQLAAPLVAAMFLVDVGLGMLARTTPQFNIFVLGIPIKIIVGFFILFMLLPGLVFLFRELFEQMFTALHELIRLMAPNSAE